MSAVAQAKRKPSSAGASVSATAEVAERHPARRRALVVLGMHRSGTSALARVVSLLGADLPTDLMPALPGNNETGFWESQELVDIDDQVLASGGSSWDDLSAFPDSWIASPLAPVFREKAVRVLARDFEQSSLFVLKDPRFCLLVPFWTSILEELGAEPAFLIMIRNPLEIAASLKRRDGFPPAKSCLLFLRYMLAAERETRAYPRTFVNFETLLEDWQGAAARMSRELDLEWPRRVTAEIESFLDDHLRHHVFAAEDVAAREGFAGWVSDIYSAAMAASRGDQRALRQTFDTVRQELEIADRAFTPLIVGSRLALAASESEISRLGHELSVHQTETARLAEELAARDAEIARSQGELEASESERGRLGQELDARDARILQLEKEPDAQSVEPAERREELTELRGRLRSRDFELGRRDRELDGLDQRVQRLQTELESSRSQCRSMLAEIAEAAGPEPD